MACLLLLSTLSIQMTSGQDGGGGKLVAGWVESALQPCCMTLRCDYSRVLSYSKRDTLRAVRHIVDAASQIKQGLLADIGLGTSKHPSPAICQCSK